MISTEDVVIPDVTSNPETDGISVTYDREKKAHKITNKGVLKIKAGDNVKVDNETGVVTISVAIPETSPDEDDQGISATVPNITNITYSTQTHQLVAKLQKLTFTNGILTASGDEREEVVFTAIEHEEGMDG